MKSFVNFSNHPSKAWDKNQIRASLEYGPIVDIPFPSVDPEMDEKDISKLADQCTEEICAHDPAAVMCQGEFTLVYAVICKLKEKGIKVVAACSKRMTKTDNFIKLSYFAFIRYREYQ